jgi:hypothetical protein
MSQRKEKRGNIDNNKAIGMILEHLINLEDEGKTGQTIYGIRNKAFRNSQRNERIKYLVGILLKKGYIESFQSGEDKTLYVINENGKNFYRESVRKVMDLFREEI